MRLPGARSLAQTGRWLRSKVAPGALILLYHRIAEPRDQPGDDPFRLCVSPGRFSEQLEALRRVARPCALPALCDVLAAGRRPRSAVAVTFDDGYLDNLEEAKPLLERYEVPATFFVVSGELSGRFWWDELVDALFRPSRLPPRLELTLDGRCRRWRLASSAPSARRRLLIELHRRLKSQSPDACRELVAQVAAWSGNGNGSEDRPRVVSAAELRRLAAAELAEIGSHGVTHSALAALPPAARRREIEESKSRLEASTGRPVTSFSYPYGQRADLDASCESLVAAAGYERACTAIVDVARAGESLFRLPRLWVGDWSGERFAGRLRQWLGS